MHSMIYTIHGYIPPSYRLRSWKLRYGGSGNCPKSLCHPRIRGYIINDVLVICARSGFAFFHLHKLGTYLFILS